MNMQQKFPPGLILNLFLILQQIIHMNFSGMFLRGSRDGFSHKLFGIFVMVTLVYEFSELSVNFRVE
ncbi:hypothetical protein Glove_306g54 [Diversispora epigaea]|uniref:Uncharacterized protein n=1 Tax=Diversispora epigaea TaxID=1348612 RepID=A0A397HUD0_9GLOM|nr:hypothetical protein Glove_306g54 [Diversispora epigaea]